MTLKVQEYLRNGKTLEDLLVEYGVDSKTNDSLGIVTLNYNQIVSNMSLDIPQECRGLILELNTWNVVSRSFKKFFNYSESQAASINWNTARVQEKIDGTLVMFYHYKGSWHVATKKCTEAEGSCGDNNFTFKDLVVKTINKLGYTWAEFTSQLDKNIFYSFELTSPDNRLVVLYYDYRLTLLGAWSALSLLEISFNDTMHSMPQGISCIQELDMPLGDFDALVEVVNARNPQLYEGIVVVDGAKHRVKIKSLLHVLSSRARDGVATEKAKLQLILDEKVDDMVGILPVGVMQEIEEIERSFNDMFKRVYNVYDLRKDIETQRDFALAIKDYAFSGWLFEMRKGLSLAQVIEQQYKRRGINSVYRVYCAIMGKQEEIDKEIEE